MTQKLHNPFNITSERTITAKVWHKNHELCEKQFGFERCKKDTINFRIPHVIATKVDDFCQRHQRTFDNEQHQLPSGKTLWLGCPICQRNNTNFRHQQDFVMSMKDAGMRWNEETREFFKPSLPGEEVSESPKYKPAGYRRQTNE